MVGDAYITHLRANILCHSGNNGPKSGYRTPKDWLQPLLKKFMNSNRGVLII